jgi:hypothetical protein
MLMHSPPTTILSGTSLAGHVKGSLREKTFALVMSGPSMAHSGLAMSVEPMLNIMATVVARLSIGEMPFGSIGSPGEPQKSA